MERFRIRIANCVIEVESFFDDMSRFFRAFLTEDKPDAHLHIRETDIEIEKQHSIYNEVETGNNIYSIALASLQRKIAQHLIEEDSILFHGAAIAIGDQGYIFSGKSGTGKTTHIYKWGMQCSDMCIVNGDKPFVNCSNVPYLCSSPWAGKEELYKNVSFPLKAIIFMERAEENHIEQISFAEAFPRLLQQVYRPEDEEKMRKTLRLMQRLNGPVSFWRFQCNNFKDDCFDVAYNALVGEQK